MKLTCVILAAGMGKRMHSALPKMLHRLCGKPMLQYVIDSADALNPDKKIVVVGKHCEEIKRSIAAKGSLYVLQEKPLGTGDALLRAMQITGSFSGTVLVLNGDMPLITGATLKRFLAYSRNSRNSLSILSFMAEDPSAYGRILRDTAGRAEKIIEDINAIAEQKMIKEVNSGVYALNPEAVRLLSGIKINRLKGEYYLTDLLELAVSEKLRTGVCCTGSEMELAGINTGQDLLKAEKVMQERIINALIEKGLRVVDKASVYINSGVAIGRDTIIYPHVVLEGKTKIGRGCTICPNVRIINSSIGNNTAIKDSSVIEDSVIGSNAQIGPFAHLRPSSKIGSRVKIGNFVEVKKSKVGAGTKISHLSYIGDSIVGKDVNIGAGTITCNYDGKKKHVTNIRDKVFIGSDTQLIAPVNIGKGAYIGAGSTIVRDVPPRALAVSRVKQEIIEDWALKSMKRRVIKDKGEGK